MLKQIKCRLIIATCDQVQRTQTSHVPKKNKRVPLFDPKVRIDGRDWPNMAVIDGVGSLRFDRRKRIERRSGPQIAANAENPSVRPANPLGAGPNPLRPGGNR